MTLLEYISEYLPKKFKVDKSFGNVAKMIYESEKNGNADFANENFKSLRDRAALAIPYQIDDLKERERILNILELILCIHRQEKHNEDYSKRIEELKTNTLMTKDEADLIAQPMGWWSG